MSNAVNPDIPTAKWTMVQPWRGIFAVLVSVGLTIGIAANFKVDAWAGWFTAWSCALVPIQVIIGLVWCANYPPVQKFDQPWRGLALTLFQLLIGSITTLFLIKYVGGGSINPVLNTFIISSVVVTFFLVIALGCWPFQKLSTPARGFLPFLCVFVIMALLFRLFNFNDLVAIIPPLAAIAPAGPIPWDVAVSFFLVMFAFLFAFVPLGMWPLCKFPRLMKQPVLGVVLIILCLILAYVSWLVFVNGFGMKPLNVMLGFICFVAGMLTIFVPLQGWPGRSFTQPANGFINLILSGVVAVILYYFYQYFAVSHFGVETMKNFPMNIFILAEMMLGVTFPLYVTYSIFFDYWPLPPTPPPAEQ